MKEIREIKGSSCCQAPLMMDFKTLNSVCSKCNKQNDKVLVEAKIVQEDEKKLSNEELKSLNKFRYSAKEIEGIIKDSFKKGDIVTHIDPWSKRRELVKLIKYDGYSSIFEDFMWSVKTIDNRLFFDAKESNLRK